MEPINIYSGSEVISRIYVEEGIETLEGYLEGYQHVFVVMDGEVAMKCPVAYEVSQMLNRRGVPGMLVEATEEAKCMDTVMNICGWLLDNGADRDALVLAIGGGIATDMVGFASSIYKRGVRFAHMPTTLLSQVDAAIGGKTGVNFGGYKNMLGTIRQPEFTFICPQVLESLPMEAFQAGAAEMLKTFMIEDNGHYHAAVDLLKRLTADFIAVCEDDSTLSYQEDKWPEVLAARLHELTPLIAAAVRVKAGIVSRDQFENGERRKLNLGHTFAHAIESLSHKYHNDIDHGHAVALGMVYAARLAERLELAEPGLAAAVEKDLDESLLLIINPYPLERMAGAMRKDKKAADGKVHFVLPRSIGDVTVRDLTVDEAIGLLS
ncbi:MAG: 3-dehydroquinate synthase [Bacteroidales bacterium]|nr:3-dehydroquinate synthase [Bacteroidales bacterium]